MPLFHDPQRRLLEQPLKEPPLPTDRPLFVDRRVSEESIRTEFCEGPLLIGPESGVLCDDGGRQDDGLAAESRQRSSPPLPHDSDPPPPTTATTTAIAADRDELIQRIKRSRNPSWPNKHKFPSFSDDFPVSSGHERCDAPQETKLLPAIQLDWKARGSGKSIPDAPAGEDKARERLGLEIERPKSALHAGDFTETSPASPYRQSPTRSGQPDGPVVAAATAYPESVHRCQTAPFCTPSVQLQPPLLSTSPPRPTFSSYVPPVKTPLRDRAPSLQSFSSSSFVLKTPTSPLVYGSSADQDDVESLHLSESPDFASRRHTLPPQAFQNYQSSPSSSFTTLAQQARRPPSLQRESFLPHRPNQARKSLSAAYPQSISSPQTPTFLRSRRPSFSSDASPIQHASMVGSYEESILHGRMSTTPSRPLDFTAQIGALGKGDCRPKYPAHVTVDFPAVYYSWNMSQGRNGPMEYEPSPYVGLIDLENKLPPPQPKERKKRRVAELQFDEGQESGDSTNADGSRKRTKRKHRSPSPGPKFPVGGSYRIPQQGQLQILIKNPNKTAVKLFLVPYDLSDMEPGTKTFVRQRCYSDGPIIEQPISSRRLSQSSLQAYVGPADARSKPVLRYLIQLNICSPTKGRFYLYKSVHVVFANRVPDSKERLTNQILWPEPRYSPYKAFTEPSPPPSEGLSSHRRTLEKAQRRRSYGDPALLTRSSLAAPGLPGYGVMSPAVVPTLTPAPTSLLLSKFTDSRVQSLEAYQSSVGPPSHPPPRASGSTEPWPDFSKADDKVQQEPNSVSTENGLRSRGSPFSKLSRGESGFGGLFGRPGTPEPSALAKRLRGLDMENAQKSPHS